MIHREHSKPNTSILDMLTWNLKSPHAHMFGHVFKFLHIEHKREYLKNVEHEKNNTLQHSANTLRTQCKHAANTLQTRWKHTATHCKHAANTPQHTTTHFKHTANTLQTQHAHTANTLQTHCKHTASHCKRTANTLQTHCKHTANTLHTHCDTLQHITNTLPTHQSYSANTPHHTTTHWKHTANTPHTHRNTLQHTSNTLQAYPTHTATHYNTLQTHYRHTPHAPQHTTTQGKQTANTPHTHYNTLQTRCKHTAKTLQTRYNTLPTHHINIKHSGGIWRHSSSRLLHCFKMHAQFLAASNALQYAVKRDPFMSKRDAYTCQKRPTYTKCAVSCRVARAWISRQKRPIYMSKETQKCKKDTHIYGETRLICMPKRDTDTCTCQTRLEYGVLEIVALFCRIRSFL